MELLEWDAWSTQVQIGADSPAGLERLARITREVMEMVTIAASRFEPGTDVLRVNECAGSWVDVSETMIELVRESVRVAEITNGLVTPLIGRALLGIGYDRDISDVGGATVTVFEVERDWHRIECDANRIRIPTNSMLDLGASAKAWTSDRVAERAWAELGEPVLVSIGGDIAVRGEPVGGFLVEVSERHVRHEEDAPDQRIRIHDGGLATSTTVVRRWRSDNAVMHHIIDPATALPAQGAFRTATVAAATCADANAASTAAIIMGETAIGWLSAAKLPSRLVTNDGEVITVGDWPVELA